MFKTSLGNIMRPCLYKRKFKNLARCGGVHLRFQLLRRLRWGKHERKEFEAAVNYSGVQDCSELRNTTAKNVTAFQTG